jgi:hypothetical protein
MNASLLSKPWLLPWRLPVVRGTARPHPRALPWRRLLRPSLRSPRRVRAPRPPRAPAIVLHGRCPVALLPPPPGQQPRPPPPSPPSATAPCCQRRARSLPRRSRLAAPPLSLRPQRLLRVGSSRRRRPPCSGRGRRPWQKPLGTSLVRSRLSRLPAPPWLLFAVGSRRRRSGSGAGY